jgi:hypothetical protein
MALWTDIIDPATLTGYARAAMEDYEARQGSLARWLPNRTVADIVVRFVKGETGLVDAAKFRAYDAEIEIGKRPSRNRVTLELPALGRDEPVSEYEQLRARGGTVPDELALTTIQAATRRGVRSTADAIERLRGIVIATGKATIDQDNFQSDDDFGRPAGHSTTVSSLWSSSSADRLGPLEVASDVVEDATGEAPGCMVMSRRVLRALAAGDELATQLVNGSTRPATEAEARSAVGGAGLPDIVVYNRRVSVNGVATKVLPDDTVFFLPAPVDPNDEEGTDFGTTFWGRTLTSTDPAWAIEDGEQPGIVTGVFRNEKPPMGLEIIADAIGLPVLANANRSYALKVL